ncbi:MAG: BamA/TamA family outer membrane protein [Bacteroidota bacterium]
MEPNEYLLGKNTIHFEGKYKPDDKRTLRYEMSRLYKQKPNNKLFFNYFVDRSWFYLATEAPGDTTWWDNWQRKALGEPPTIFNPDLMENTAESMEYFLKYKGYYNAQVFPDNYIKRKKMYVDYNVNTGYQHIIDSVFYKSRDLKVDSIINSISATSAFKRGNGLDAEIFEQDKDRIAKHLRNSGYAFFYSNSFAPMLVDTLREARQADITIEVLPPFDDSTHTQYYVGDIKIYTAYSPITPDSLLRDTFIQNYHFVVPLENPFPVKAQTIIDQLFLRPGALYQQDLFEKTNQQLSKLGALRFVRLKQVVDTLANDKLNIRVELRPNFKMEMGVDFEVNYTNRNNANNAGSLIGISISPTFRNRNVFGGAEVLATNISAGVEINPNLSGERFWNTIDLRFQNDLYFPRFLDYLKFWKGLSKIKLGKKGSVIRPSFYQQLEESATTRTSLSYNYLLILDWYRYHLLNASYGFDFQKSNTHRYIINHIGIDYLSPRTEPDFEELQKVNPFLERSFGQQLFVGLLFRDFSYVYNGRPNRFGESNYFGLNIELSGFELWGVNSLFNQWTGRNDVFGIGSTNFSQYWRIEGDYRYYRTLSAKHSLAARAYLGVARPFGFTSDVPYVKQFFAGGPNGIRAWAARGLGPGGFEDPESRNPNNTTRLYQTGDIHLEANVEYRFDIFWLLKGALFIDAGNVWTFNRDPDRCGSQFLFTESTFSCGTEDTFTNDPFYKQIAIGTGFGFRFDLTYFLLRLDLGVRLRNSFPRRDGNSVTEADYWEDFQGFRFNRNVSFNLGLGYPF